MPDIKGDLSGISQPGKENPKVTERRQQAGLGPIEFQGAPTIFWDIFGQDGHPVRDTVSDLGPLLFDGASRAFIEKVELVVRLIRSKGAGVYLITQNPRRRCSRRRGVPPPVSLRNRSCAPFSGRFSRARHHGSTARGRIKLSGNE